MVKLNFNQSLEEHWNEIYNCAIRDISISSIVQQAVKIIFLTVDVRLPIKLFF